MGFGHRVKKPAVIPKARLIRLTGYYFISFLPRRCAACNCLVWFSVMSETINDRYICKTCTYSRGVYP